MSEQMGKYERRKVDELVEEGLKKMKSTEWMRQLDEVKESLDSIGREALRDYYYKDYEDYASQLKMGGGNKPDIPLNSSNMNVKPDNVKHLQDPLNVSMGTLNQMDGLFNLFDQMYVGNKILDEDTFSDEGYRQSLERSKALQNLFDYYVNKNPDFYLATAIHSLMVDESNLRLTHPNSEYYDADNPTWITEWAPEGHTPKNLKKLYKEWKDWYQGRNEWMKNYINNGHQYTLKG